MSIPPILYKYRDWDNVFQKRILTHNEICLSSYEKFNDPFDTSLPFTYKENEITYESMFNKLYALERQRSPWMQPSELEKQCNAQLDNQGIHDTLFWLKKEYEKSKDSLQYGIFSLATHNDNLLMWSHYANSHRGLCIGFDINLLERVSLGHLKKVTYSNEFYQIGINDEIKEFDNLFLLKSDHWAYEDEFRIIKRGSANEIITFPDDAIRKIIIGLKTPENHKSEILKLAYQKFSAAEICFCQLNSSKFELDLVTVSKTQHSS
jgi:hypothetical protein